MEQMETGGKYWASTIHRKWEDNKTSGRKMCVSVKYGRWQEYMLSGRKRSIFSQIRETAEDYQVQRNMVHLRVKMGS